MNSSTSSVVSLPKYSVLYLLFDYDGSMVHPGYISHDDFDLMSPDALAEDQTIVTSNKVIFDYIEEQIRLHPTIQIISIGFLSLREGYLSNLGNSLKNKTECYFRATEKWVKHLKVLFPTIKIIFQTILPPDVENSLAIGSSFQHALESSYSLDTILTMQQRELNGIGTRLKSKRDLFYMHAFTAHKAFSEQEVLMVAFDDLLIEVLHAIRDTFSTPKGQQALPSNISSKLCHYQEGKLEEVARLTFTGGFNPCYSNQLRLLWKKPKDTVEAEFEKVLTNELKPPKPPAPTMYGRQSPILRTSRKVEGREGFVFSSFFRLPLNGLPTLSALPEDVLAPNLTPLGNNEDDE